MALTLFCLLVCPRETSSIAVAVAAVVVPAPPEGHGMCAVVQQDHLPPDYSDPFFLSEVQDQGGLTSFSTSVAGIAVVALVFGVLRPCPVFLVAFPCNRIVLTIIPCLQSWPNASEFRSEDTALSFFDGSFVYVITGMSFSCMLYVHWLLLVCICMWIILCVSPFPRMNVCLCVVCVCVYVCGCAGVHPCRCLCMLCWRLLRIYLCFVFVIDDLCLLFHCITCTLI